MSSSSPVQADRGAVTPKQPLSILLLARSLDIGGTERQLVQLAIALRERGHSVRVALFYGGGVLADELARAGIDIIDLRKSGRWDVAQFLTRTISAVRSARPDLMYSFLGGANVTAAIAARFVPSATLVWSVRNSGRDISVANLAERLAFRLEAWLARRADAIIANSSAGREFAIGRGFPRDRIFVVPNGIDTARFRPDRQIRAEQRAKLGLSDDAIAVGVLGRLNAAKDYPTFLRAAQLVARETRKARFLCVGGGPELPKLRQLASELQIADAVLFTGEVDPVAALNAFDIACSPSLTEGFSNSIAEAMACGLPCVVTDAGDSAAIVGDLGRVVPISSPEALAKALQAEIATLSEHDPAKPRARIVEKYSVGAMVDGTLDVFQSARASRTRS